MVSREWGILVGSRQAYCKLWYFGGGLLFPQKYQAALFFSIDNNKKCFLNAKSAY